MNVLGDCWESGGSGVRSLEDGPGYGVKVSLRTGSMPLEVSDIILLSLARQGRPLTGILSPTTDTSNLRPGSSAPRPQSSVLLHQIRRESTQIEERPSFFLRSQQRLAPKAGARRMNPPERLNSWVRRWQDRGHHRPDDGQDVHRPAPGVHARALGGLGRQGGARYVRYPPSPTPPPRRPSLIR